MNVRRISIGPGEVAGYFSRLKAGFEELGIPCEHFVLTPNKFNYQESNYFLRGIYLKLAKLRTLKSSLIRYVGYCLEAILRLFVFLYAMIRCDVFIIPGFGSFFRFYELPLMRLFGKKIIVVYLGSDARPPFLSGRHLDDIGKPFDCEATKNEVMKQVALIRKVEKYANLIVNHTATAQFFIRDFILLNSLGMPVEKYNPSLTLTNTNYSRPVRILHAPSRPLAKGSLDFKKVIDELRFEGYKIDFIELVGVPNSVVLRELEHCDFVLDELYSDVPMAMFATEAAVFGKPVIVGGYYAEQYKIDNPSNEYPPSLYVLPSNIKQAIRKMIDDKSYRLELGEYAKRFVNQYWNIRNVAKNYMRLIDNDIPENWWGAPKNFPYLWGWGLSQDNWRLQVGEYVSQVGVDGLAFDHNQMLVESVLSQLKAPNGT